MKNILELRNVSKTFPGVKALDGVHFELKPGEIHALMGENGAGKSTFIKIITGVYQPDSGEIVINGENAFIKSPLDAQALGIAAIYQHVTCFPDITAAENIFMGHEKTSKPFGRIDWKTMNKDAQILLDRLDANFDSRAEMGSLSVAQQQIVEIAKALSANARIIIMDEPTAPLSNRECEDLYHITESLRDKGVSIIFISHRFEDMYRLAGRVTVFRDGKYICTWNRADMVEHDLVVAMVGREIVQFFPKRDTAPGEEIFRVEGLSRTGYFRDVGFSVRRGEILALTGLVGAGRTEVCEAIYGITSYNSGSVILNGKKLPRQEPAGSIASGIGYLPEDRLKQGLVLRWEIAKNITLPALKKFLRYGIVNTGQENREAGEIAGRLGVKAVSVHDRVSTLSGGNQQKVIVAKLLTGNMKLIILDEPTKGVDVGAKTAIYEIMNELVKMGYGIIMVSSEMPEVLGMSDRIVVMRDGRITAAFDTKGADQTTILKAAMQDVSKTGSGAVA
ncbi:MAG: sugar ABC transporter ATP-binding protein [Treponema sp.]|jgi:rhamnose transport system ATP-binding protein|nr:sugar ABC transporter ATP-binding protein [Treponema sp.]